MSNPAGMIHWPDVVSILGHCRRRWHSIEPIPSQCLLGKKDMRHPSYAGLMLDHRLRRWSNISQHRVNILCMRKALSRTCCVHRGSLYARRVLNNRPAWTRACQHQTSLIHNDPFRAVFLQVKLCSKRLNHYGCILAKMSLAISLTKRSSQNTTHRGQVERPKHQRFTTSSGWKLLTVFFLIWDHTFSNLDV